MDTGNFEWTVRLYATHWLKTVLLVSIMVLVCVLVYYSFQQMLFSVLTAIFLFFSLVKFFLPIRYIFDENGVQVITPFGRQNKTWIAFKSFYPDKQGVLLSPFPTKSWLENFRGLYVIYQGADRDRILTIIKNRIVA
jgi:hypothetical protein